MEETGPSLPIRVQLLLLQSLLKTLCVLCIWLRFPALMHFLCAPHACHSIADLLCPHRNINERIFPVQNPFFPCVCRGWPSLLEQLHSYHQDKHKYNEQHEICV